MPLLRRRTPLLRTVLATSAALVLACVVLLAFLRVDRVVSASGRLVGGSRVVRTPADGLVQEVLVRADQRVRAGEVLVVLESDELHSERLRAEAQIRALEGRIAALEARRDHLAAVRQPAARSLAGLAEETARVERDSAIHRAEVLEELAAGGLVDALTRDEARARSELARLGLERATRELGTLAPEQAYELAALEADLLQASSLLDETRLSAADLARREASTRVVAPVGGVVVAADLGELTGKRVLAGEELVRIADGRADAFVAVVPGRDRVHVARDMSVRLRVDGYPWLLHGTVPGRVTSVAASAGADGGFPVEVALERGDLDLELFEGMRADARILVAERVRLGELLLDRLDAR